MGDKNMNNEFDIVKSTIKLSEIVPGNYKKIPSGIRYAICPICSGEKSFSIMLPGTKGNSCEIFKCFKCDNHGSIIDYYCIMNGLNPNDKKDVSKALVELKKQYITNIKISTLSKHEYIINNQNHFSREKIINYDFTTLAYELHKNLINKENLFAHLLSKNQYQDMAISYYINRGLSIDIIKKFKLGYNSIGMNDAFKDYPNLRINKNIDFYNYFIPFFENGKCIYILPRLSNEKYEMHKHSGLEKPPKTMNLRGIPSQIFNFQEALNGKVVFITEGWCDALSIETLGYNALALNGVSNINLFIKKLKNVKDYINKYYVIAFDSDNPGTLARDKLSMELTNLKCKVKHLYPYGNNIKDINDMLLKNKDKLKNELNSIIDDINLKFTK